MIIIVKEGLVSNWETSKLKTAIVKTFCVLPESKPHSLQVLNIASDAHKHSNHTSKSLKERKCWSTKINLKNNTWQIQLMFLSLVLSSGIEICDRAFTYSFKNKNDNDESGWETKVVKTKPQHQHTWFALSFASDEIWEFSLIHKDLMSVSSNNGKMSSKTRELCTTISCKVVSVSLLGMLLLPDSFGIIKSSLSVIAK